jgi:hypothetical protein
MAVGAFAAQRIMSLLSFKHCDQVFFFLLRLQDGEAIQFVFCDGLWYWDTPQW